MSSYNNVIEIAKNLREEFDNKISLFESLQIAAQINQAQLLSDGLLVNNSKQPVALEAIAMILGFKPDDQYRTTIIDAIKNRD